MTTQSNATEPETGELADEATPLPWLWFQTDDGYSVCSSGGPCEDHFVPDPHCHQCVVLDGVTAANASLICRAVNSHAGLERERDALRLALFGMLTRAEALDSLLAAYRLGRHPNAKTFRELEQTRDVATMARAALGETK